MKLYVDGWAPSSLIVAVPDPALRGTCTDTANPLSGPAGVTVPRCRTRPPGSVRVNRTGETGWRGSLAGAPLTPVSLQVVVYQCP